MSFSTEDEPTRQSGSNNSTEFARVFESQRRSFRSTNHKERLALINRFHEAFLKWRPKFQQAVEEDLRRPGVETDVAELLVLHIHFKHVKRKLKKWMKSQRVKTPLVLFGSSSRIVYEPKGVVLVISPWNYPLNLSLTPLLDALAAGNKVIIKPSELTPKTSETLAQFVRETFSPEEVAIFEGGREVSGALLELPFDHIMFTGSPGIAKHIMNAAAKQLIPVTLELGGKSPVVVDKSVNIREAAEKIIWGKRLNSGQTCLAPDYVLVDREIESKLIEAMKDATKKFGVGLQPIVNGRHFDRIYKALQDSVRSGAVIESGGKSDLKSHSLDLTILAQTKSEHPIMAEEIFGPVLPVIGFETVDQAVAFINRGDKPLALYIFSTNRKFTDRVINETQSGGVCVNETMIHFANPHLPFGGAGVSGMGHYHGEFGFRTFSHHKAIVVQGRFNFINWFHPPYGSALTKILNVLFRLKY
jgi:aldehyde dehydrogenase (NAD+)